MGRSFLAVLLLCLLLVGPSIPLAPRSATGATATQAAATVSYASNRNYFIENNGTAIPSPSASMILTGPLLDVDSIQGANSWSLQLNTYQPLGSKPALSQYVIAYEGGLIFGEEHFVASNDAVLLNTVSSSALIPVADFVSGASFKIVLNTNSSGNVLSATYSFISGGVTLWTSNLVTNNAGLAGKIVGWQLNLIGLGAGSTATFTSASGTFSYSSSSAILWTGTFPGNESYVQYKGFPGSIEKSNVQYSLPAQVSVTSITQNFGILVQSQPLVSTTATQKTTFNPSGVAKYFGTDIGPVSWQTTLAGFKWNTSATDSLTVKPQAIGPNILSISQLYFNSSHTAYQFSGAGYSVNFFFKANNYQLTNIISGTVASPTVIRLQLSSASPPAKCDSASHSITLGGRVNVIPPCTQACFGAECYDWSDVPLADNPAYNNVTHSLTFTVTGTFVIDPLALDGTGRNGTNSATSLSCTLTTANSPDLAFAFFTIFGENSHAFTGISDTAGLTWHARVSALTGQTGEGYSYEYYAKPNSTLSSDSITITVASATFIGMICWGVSGASTASNPFDPNAGLPFTNTGTSGTTYAVTWSTTNNADFVFELAGNSNVAQGVSPNWGWSPGTNNNRISESPLSGSGVDAYGQFNITTIKHTSVSATMTCSGCSAPWQAIVDAVCSSAGCSGGTISEAIKITTLPNTTPSADFPTITISGSCGFSATNTTFKADGFNHNYTGITASCSTTLTNPGISAHIGYFFNTSPHPFAVTSISFTTASTSPGSYSNNTYFSLFENYTATPQTPSTSDGAYAFALTGTYLGVAGTTQGQASSVAGACTFPTTTFSWTQGGGAVICMAHYDYNTQACEPATIGNSWNAQAPNCFTDTTANNVHNVNYVQTSGGGGASTWLWMLTIPFFLTGIVLLSKRKRLRI